MEAPKQRSRLSQVFLHTNWPCEKLADLLLQHSICSVLEIGPGKGILTDSLLKRNFKVTCVERDLRFFTYLQQRYPSVISEHRLFLVHDDILRFDFAAWIAQAQGPVAICGNIPYHISTPLLESIFPHLGRLAIAVLLVQLEFAERLVSEPGFKSYGSLSVFAQLRANLSLVAKVERTCFVPVPKVDSAIIALLPKTECAEPILLRKVEKLTKFAFSQRRKKIRNALSKFLETVDKDRVSLDLSRRPDTLSPIEYLELAKTFQDSPFFDGIQ